MAKEDNVSFGWAGKIARVNLSTGVISTESTDPYKQYIGGMGIANKIMYDEVPAGTDPLSPESKVIFAVGPLTASGVPCSGRMNVSFLSCWSKGYSIVDAHMGGHFGPHIKYSGYDAIIVEGASDTPVWVKINDDKIEFNDAADLWGKGTRETARVIGEAAGAQYCVCCTGTAGDNMVRSSIILCGRRCGRDHDPQPQKGSRRNL